MTIKCEYCKIAGGYGDLIHETDYWMIFLAPSQRYLGTCVVVLKRQCQNLSELEDREWIDFGLIVKKLENSVVKSFNPTLYNWSCFKNATFRNENPNPEIHWHFIPRYKGEVEFGGLKFNDPDFGYIPQPIEHKIPEKVMEKIKLEINKNL
jgi:diadenosine tetraphosphate (Ap4A) HIT family hydrolase